MIRRPSLLSAVLLAATLTAAAAPARSPAPAESGRTAALATIARLGGTWRADSALAGLAHLRHLDLRLTTIGDSGAVHLEGLRELVFVNLFRTRFGDRGLAALFQSAGVETLLVGGTRVSDEGLAALGALPNLRRLSLFDTG